MRTKAKAKPRQRRASCELRLVADALAGGRGRDQKALAAEGVRLVATLLRKNQDYDGSAWKAPILCPHVPVGDAILSRASDKVARLKRLLSGRRAEVRESLADTMRDLAGYALLYLTRPKSRKG